MDRWILSKAKKDDVDEAVSKYNGEYWIDIPLCIDDRDWVLLAWHLISSSI